MALYIPLGEKGMSPGNLKDSKPPANSFADMTDNRKSGATPVPGVGTGASAAAPKAFFRTGAADTGVGFVLLHPGHVSPPSGELSILDGRGADLGFKRLSDVAQRNKAILATAQAIARRGSREPDLDSDRAHWSDGTQPKIRSRTLPMADASRPTTHLAGTPLEVTP